MICTKHVKTTYVLELSPEEGALLKAYLQNVDPEAPEMFQKIAKQIFDSLSYLEAPF